MFDWLLVYGYHPLQRTLPALALLYLLGALVVFPAARDHQSVLATRASIHQATTGPGAAPRWRGHLTADRRRAASGHRDRHLPTRLPLLLPLAFTADALIPLVNTHQTDFWAVSGATQAGRWAIHYSWLACALGWLLTTAAALGFTGLIRRD